MNVLIVELLFIYIFAMQVLWLCLLCRKRQEINTRYGKWVQETNSIPILTPLEKSELKWGRAQSLEEEADTEKNREFSNTPLRKRFPSQLNISLPTSSIFWRQDRRQQTATLRSVVRNFLIHCILQFWTLLQTRDRVVLFLLLPERVSSD